MPPSVSLVESVGRVEFPSSSSDPMLAEVAAAKGGWETIKKKKHSSRNGKQAVAMGDGSELVGLVVPPVSVGFSRQESESVTRNKVQDREPGVEVTSGLTPGVVDGLTVTADSGLSASIAGGLSIKAALVDPPPRIVSRQ